MLKLYMKDDFGKALSNLLVLVAMGLFLLGVGCDLGGDPVNDNGSDGGSNGGSGPGSGEPIFPPVIFIADKDTAGTVELYATSDDGKEIIKLSGTLVTGGNVVDFKVSPDGGSVAYVADQEIDEVFELFVVSVDKAADENAVKISGSPMAGNGVKEFSWAPDNSRVAYIADQNTADVFELYTSLPNGNSNLKISQPAEPDEDVDEFSWAPDSQRIAFLANFNLSDAVDLFTALPNISSSDQQISSGVGSGQKVTSFKWSPDSALIAFISDKGGLGFTDIFRLFTTSPVNSNNILVSGNLASTSDVKAFKWMPNGVRIAYVVKVSDRVFELYTTLRDIEASSLISDDLEDDEDDKFAWAPDSSRLAYIADQVKADVFELFTATPAGVTNDIVSALPGAPISNRRVVDFEWQPGGDRIAYLADQDVDEKFELYVSPKDTNVGNVKVSGTPMTGDVADFFLWSPDGERIAFLANFNLSDAVDLFTALPNVSSSDQQISSSMVPVS